MTAVTLLAVADAAARLNKSEGWYLTQLRTRKLPGLKVGRTWQLTEDDFDAALELMRQHAAPPPADPAGLTTGARRRITRGGTR